MNHPGLVPMPLYQAVIMGALQGLAEFAPISSSAHLVLVPWIFSPLAHHGWVAEPGQAFDAALHLGTAFALIGYFWSEWKEIIGAWVGSLTGKLTWENLNVRLAWLIIIASIPGAVFGKLFEKQFDNLFAIETHPWAPAAIGILLAVAGGILWLADRFGKKTRDITRITRGDALIVGLSQVLALFSGVSRSGATITAGLAVGMKREAAARFSFLMATPITLGAGLLKLMELRHPEEGDTHPQASALVVGILVSAIVGYAVIHWLLRYLQRQNMNLFVIYRIVFGLLVLGLWFSRHTSSEPADAGLAGPSTAANLAPTDPASTTAVDAANPAGTASPAGTANSAGTATRAGTGGHTGSGDHPAPAAHAGAPGHAGAAVHPGSATHTTAANPTSSQPHPPTAIMTP